MTRVLTAHRSGRPSRRRRGLVALAAALVLGITACSGGGDETDGPLSSGPAEVLPIQDGGEIVIGAEQEPDCADWIGTCAGAIWGDYTMKGHTVPVAFEVRKDGDNWVPQASNLLAEEPTAEEQDGGQVITYTINPEAVWSDGEPITSADFEYTALQIRDGEDVFDKTGYDKIASIETPDDKTVVLTTTEVYAGWRTLFSNTYGVLPSHLLEGKDRTAELKDGYDWSGGPWLIESWKRGTSVTLVPNDNYWGTQPALDKVTFTFITDTAAAFQALKSGQVDALYPSPQLDAISQIAAGIPNVSSQVDAQTGNLEALWINNAKPPFDSLAVRQAFAYSVDREAIVERLFGSMGVEAPAQSFFTPILNTYGSSEFEKYGLDLSKVDELMTGDGWAKDSDGFWAKDGERASFVVETLAGNKRRELTLQILQAQFGDAGFEMSIHNTTPANLFGKLAPNGDFDVALYTLIDTFPDPTLTATLSSTAIPSEANGFSGINFGRVNIEGLDPILQQIDAELDTEQRVELTRQADVLIADAVPALPLDAVPNVLLWSTELGGPISINPSKGPFWNLEEWGLAR